MINFGFNFVSDQDRHVGPPEYNYLAVTCADHNEKLRGSSNLIRAIIFLALDGKKCSFDCWISFKGLSCLVNIKHPLRSFGDQVCAKSVFIHYVVA